MIHWIHIKTESSHFRSHWSEGILYRILRNKCTRIINAFPTVWEPFFHNYIHKFFNNWPIFNPKPRLESRESRLSFHEAIYTSSILVIRCRIDLPETTSKPYLLIWKLDQSSKGNPVPYCYINCNWFQSLWATNVLWHKMATRQNLNILVISCY